MRSAMTPTMAGSTAAAISMAMRIQPRSTQSGSVTKASRNVAAPGTAMPSSAASHSTEPNAAIER